MTGTSITVVTPSLNQGIYLRQCLESVAAQSVVAEHIVMDGGSTDGTTDLLQRFSRAGSRSNLHWTSAPDRGQSNALNKGFRRASGEIVGWLNADDRYRAGCFQSVLDTFQNNPQVDVIYGDYTWIDAQGKTIQLRREISFSSFVLLYHRVLYIPTTAMFFRRRILDEGHLLDESLHYAMDFEFFVRLSARGYRFMHVPGYWADFRFQPESKTTRHPERQLQEQMMVMRQYSPLLRRCARNPFLPWLEKAFRAAAAVRRYSEKCLRGYYFTQFRPANLSK